MPNGTADDARRSVCARIDQSISALERLLDRPISGPRRIAVLQRLAELRRRRIAFRCDEAVGWGDLGMPEPSAEEITATTSIYKVSLNVKGIQQP